MDKKSRKTQNSRQKPEKSALLGFQGAVKASKQKACAKLKVAKYNDRFSSEGLRSLAQDWPLNP